MHLCLAKHYIGSDITIKESDITVLNLDYINILNN